MGKKEKTLSADQLAGARAEGSNPPDREGCTNSVADFLEKNHSKLLRACHARWNGSGEDVLQAAAILCAGAKKINLKYFMMKAREAARNLDLRQWRHTPDGVVIEPPREGMATPPEYSGREVDERILAAMRYASPEIAEAMRKVLEGHTFRQAAHDLGLTESQLSQRLAKLGGRTSGQPNLFVSGVAR